MNRAKVPIRRVFRVVNGGTPTSDPENWEGEIAWATPVDLGRRNGKTISSTDRTLTQAGLRSGSRAVPEESLLVSSRAPIGYVAETACRMAFNQGCKGLEPTEAVDVRFFRYQLSTMTEDLQSRGLGSTFLELSADALASTPIVVPALQEQRAIADYLDTETSRIDTLITKKRRMIELLEERRHTAIRHALQSARQQGERRPLRAYADVQLGRQRSPQHAEGPHMTAYLRAANVKDGILDLSDVKSMNFTPTEQERFALREGDVLVSEGSGSLSAVGASAVWNGEINGTICFQNTLLRLRPRSSTDPRFLAWWCRYAHTDGLFASIATGANIYHISAERVRSLRMNYVVPSEQRAIADHLDTETARIEALIESTHEVIALLSERRQALITAAVTGELHIR